MLSKWGHFLQYEGSSITNRAGNLFGWLAFLAGLVLIAWALAPFFR